MGLVVSHLVQGFNGHFMAFSCSTCSGRGYGLKRTVPSGTTQRTVEYIIVYNGINKLTPTLGFECLMDVVGYCPLSPAVPVIDRVVEAWPPRL